MTYMSGVADQLRDARSIPELLGAACDAFEVVLTLVRRHDRPEDGWFVPMVIAAAWAGTAAIISCSRHPFRPSGQGLHSGWTMTPIRRMSKQQHGGSPGCARRSTLSSIQPQRRLASSVTGTRAWARRAVHGRSAP